MFSRLSLLEKYYLCNPSYYKKEFTFTTTTMPQKHKQKNRKVLGEGSGSDNKCKTDGDKSGDGIYCSLYTQHPHKFNDDSGHNPNGKFNHSGDGMNKTDIVGEMPNSVDEKPNEDGCCCGESDKTQESNMLRNTRLAIQLLEDEEMERDDEWEINNNSKSSDDFEDLFDLKRSTLIGSMKIEDILEIISKIKGLDYISTYPYLGDRRGLIMDLDECFVKYCTIHGIPIEYAVD